MRNGITVLTIFHKHTEHTKSSGGPSSASSPDCSSPILLRSHTCRRLSVPLDAKIVSLCGDHCTCKKNIQFLTHTAEYILYHCHSHNDWLQPTDYWDFQALIKIQMYESLAQNEHVMTRLHLSITKFNLWSYSHNLIESDLELFSRFCNKN